MQSTPRFFGALWAAMLTLALMLAAQAALAQTGDVEVHKGVEYAVHGGVKLTGDYCGPRAPARQHR